MPECGDDNGFVELGFAKIDTERQKRTSVPEVIYAPGKTKQQLASLFGKMHDIETPLIATKVDQEKASYVLSLYEGVKYFSDASILARSCSMDVKFTGNVAVVTAGTSDIPIAEEAAVTLELLGVEAGRFFDVGVAGLHRLMNALPEVRKFDLLIVVAGMEGALPSVVGGLVRCPVIAVPTSVGYGGNFGGMSALLGMMNSCAPGISVVNIDNGFGAGVCAYKWLLMAESLGDRLLSGREAS